MAKKRKIDNLPADASASDLEQAILEHQNEQTDSAAEPVVEEASEAVEAEVVESEKTTELPAEQAKEEKAEAKEATEGYDYKQGYENLRAWQTKMAQEFSELKGVMQQAVAKPQEPARAQQAAQPAITQEQFNEWYQQDPVSASRWMASLEAEQKITPIDQRIRGVESTLNNILADSTVTKYKAQYDDFSALSDDIKNELGRYPREMQDNPAYFEFLLDNSYWAAKGRRLKEAEEKAKEEGRREATMKAVAKKNAYVEGGGRPTSEAPLNPGSMSSSELFDLMVAKGIANKE